MNDRETRRYDIFGGAQIFGADNTADFAAGGEARKRFANIGGIISDLDDAKAGQGGGGSPAIEVFFDALRFDLRNITRTAAANAQDKTGFAETFRPPDSLSQGALKTTADAFLAPLQDAARPSCAKVRPSTEE